MPRRLIKIGSDGMNSTFDAAFPGKPDRPSTHRATPPTGPERFGYFIDFAGRTDRQCRRTAAARSADRP